MDLLFRYLLNLLLRKLHGLGDRASEAVCLVSELLECLLDILQVFVLRGELLLHPESRRLDSRGWHGLELAYALFLELWRQLDVLICEVRDIFSPQVVSNRKTQVWECSLSTGFHLSIEVCYEVCTRETLLLLKLLCSGI